MSVAATIPSRLSGADIAARIDELAAFSDDPSCLTRLTLSPSHKAAAAHVAEWMREAGMDVRMDGVGNVIGRYEAKAAGKRTLLIGSHIDTVRNAGKYDGNLGVIAGIAAVDELNRRGLRLPFAIEVVAFSDEEGARFPTTLSGSRAIAGAFDPACLESRDADGLTRRMALAEFGCAANAILPADPAGTIGYLELHIEQGPVLEAQGLALGVVTAINGATRGEVVVKGVAGHSGTLPMHMRHDALVAAAQMIVAIERRAVEGEDVVATVGRIETPNGAVNIVPGEVRFSLDVRSSSDEARRRALADIDGAMQDVARARGVTAAFAPSYDMPAAPCDAAMVEAIAEAFKRKGHTHFRLGSGAGHDGMSFRGVLPIGMIFVRCRGGVSHNPAEYASPEDMGAAAHVLYDLLTSGAFA